MDVQDDEKSAEMTDEVDKALESETADSQDSSEGTVNAVAPDSVDGEPNSDADVSESDVAVTEEQMTTSEEPAVEEAEAGVSEEPESAKPEEESQTDDEGDKKEASDEEAATESAGQVDQVPSPQQDPADINEYVGTAEADISIPIKEASPKEEEKPTLVSPEKDDGREWYVVHCYSGYENKVRHNIEQRIETMGMKDLIFDVVVPTEEEIEVKDGKRRTVERRVFPGYILINMILGEESWYVVSNTPGVTSFVGMGEEPTPLRPEEVSQIIKRMESDAPRIKVTFKQGERVRIVDGPFNDFRGNVEEIDMERAKVRVMVNFFGRETPVELDFLQVEKA